MEPFGPARTQAFEAVVGRDAELAALSRFLGPAGQERALVLAGEPGMGKTTLWEAAVESARGHGVRVLCARASEAEARLPFAGLSDLLDGLNAGVFAGLLAPQRHALEVALGLAEPVGGPQPFAISAGFLGALRSLADQDSLLVSVDDVQWLDRQSGDAIAFAARRLGDRPVRFLLSQRAGRPSPLEQVFAPKAIVRLELSTLSFGAISRLLSERLGEPLPRRVLRQVFRTAQGNPLFALELGRALAERGIPDVGAELPVPELLDDLFVARVSRLASPLRRVLLACSLSAGLSRSELATVVDPLAVEDALSSGLLVVERSQLRPSHPLLASAAARGSTAADRRDLHLALADAVSDQTLRGRHAALAAALPDAKLARTVAAAAVVASERGAVEDALELAGHALRLTPADDAERSERLLELARLLHITGDLPRATELLEAEIDALPAGPARAEAYLMLGEEAPFSVEEEHLERALAERPEDPGLSARALARKSVMLSLCSVERIPEAEVWALEALPAARSAGPEVGQRVVVALAWARVLRGRPIDDLVGDSATGSVAWSLYESSIDRPVGVRHAFRGELEQARSVFLRLLALADERGEARSGMVFATQLCELELRAGAASKAAGWLKEWEQWIALESEIEIGNARSRLEATLAAVRGLPEEAERPVVEVLEASRSDPGFGWDRLEAMRAAGIAALFDRDAKRALTMLQPVWEHKRREGVDDPGAFPVEPDLVEALVETDEILKAGEVIERLRRLASEQRHPWGLATAKRCAAVVQLADHNLDGAAGELADAASAFGRMGLGFDQGRSLLYLGRAQRRFKKRADARRSLAEAQAVFAQGGCDGWAEQARADLARISGRRSVEDGMLTPSERGVAELAARGLSNKEIAAALFISVYTVEGHLKSTYAKLEIRSRTQLARRLDEP